MSRIIRIVGACAVCLALLALPGSGRAGSNQKASKPAGDLNGPMIQAIGLDDTEYAGELIDRGADPNARLTSEGLTALMIVQSKKMAEFLLAHGASALAVDDDGAGVLHHLVTTDAVLDTLPLLISAGADMNARAKGWSNETPLLTAKALFFEGHPFDRAERVLRYLVRNGADLNAADNLGYTLLHTAAVNRKPEMVKLLLDLGADKARRSADGMTPLDYARELKFPEIAAMLE